MKKIYLISTTLIAAIVIVLTTFTNTYSYPEGAPAGVSGSPGDGNQTCARSGCHTGTTPQSRNGMITSNIPAEGYIPGQTYTVTVSIQQSDISRWGFQTSAQTSSGDDVGTLVLTNNAQTQLTGSGKYITHTTAGNGGSAGSKSWTFDWIAPNAGTGSFSFYASVMAANNNGGRSGDLVFTDQLSVSESISTGFASRENESLSIYPTPLVGNSLYFHVGKANVVINSIRIYSLTGALVADLSGSLLPKGGNELQLPVNNLKSGTYLFVASHTDGVFVKKLFQR
jgi:hypothetical protein